MSAVYKAIAAVQGELAAKGISKDSENSFDHYKFRGIDAVYNALSPLLSKHGLCVLPRIIERDLQERVSRKGEPMFYVTVTAEFDFVSSEDGSCHTVRTYGEAMDRSDKATNKAMSAAYKYAAFMAFAIPTEGDNDADATTPELGAARGGQSSDSAVSRPANDTPGRELAPSEKALKKGIERQPQKRAEKWEGVYSGKSALHAGMMLVDRNVRGCGDDAELTAYEQTQEFKDFVWSAEKYAPHYLYGGPPAPEEFVGIYDLIKRMRDDFHITENSALRAG